MRVQLKVLAAIAMLVIDACAIPSEPTRPQSLRPAPPDCTECHHYAASPLSPRMPSP